jgi:Fuc2NAc and GlcNAc transferase
MIYSGLFLVVAAALLSFGASFLVLRNARKLGVIANPNERSSHTIPTPSGGGVGIVAGGALAGFVVAWFAPYPTWIVLLTAVAIAAIGFLDDRDPIPATYRLGAQFLLTSFVVALAVPLEGLHAGIGLPIPGGVLVLIAVLASVYWINIYNFMDGIDGLAASQAAFMLFGAALLTALAQPAAPDRLEFWWLVAMGSSAAAFLALNWPPAKIFMGDAGSTFLGFVIAFFALTTIALGWLSLWQWAILAASFMVDATVTLVRRVLLRDSIFTAHRRHAYQRLSRRWKSHRSATLAYIGINVIWLLPLAYIAGPGSAWAVPATLAAYVPLVALAWMVGAGKPEEAA